MTIAAVRRLRRADREDWERLWNAYIRFYRARVPDEVTEQTFERLCNGAGGLAGLVAVDGQDRPIGLARLVFHASTWAKTHYCYLEDLFVDSAHRGGGTAARLIDAVYECARQHGASRVYWLTQQYNGPARSLYDSVGQLTAFVVYEHRLGE